MIKLTDKETQLFLTIRGNTPLNYSYQRETKFDISNKLLFIYPELERLTTINHDMIRLVQKLNIKSDSLSYLILSLNYSANYNNVDMAKELFSQLYSLLQILNLDYRDDTHFYNNEEIVFDKSLMIYPEPTMTEELVDLSIEEGLGLIELYYYGSYRRGKGNFILFNRYLKDNPKLLLADLLFIQENFRTSYKDIPLSRIDHILREDPKLINRCGENELICFRSPGECSDWGLPFIEVNVSFEKNEEGLFDLRYIEYTSGDDYTQGFWKNDLSHDDLDKFIAEVVLPYLEDCKETGMKDSPEFKKYFLSHDVDEDDLDFN